MKTGPKPSPPRNTAPTTQQSRHRPKPMTKPSPPGSDAWRRRRRRRRRGGENWECEWARGGLTSRWSSWGRQVWFGEWKRSETFSWGCLDGGKTGDQKIMGKLGREGLSLGDSRERKRVWGESSSGVLMGTRGMVTTQSECGDRGVLNSRVDSRGSGEWLSRLTRLPPNLVAPVGPGPLSTDGLVFWWVNYSFILGIIPFCIVLDDVHNRIFRYDPSTPWIEKLVFIGDISLIYWI